MDTFFSFFVLPMPAVPQEGSRLSSSSSSFLVSSLGSPLAPPKPKLKSLKVDFFQKLGLLGFSSSFFPPTPPKLQLVPQPPIPKPPLDSSFLVVESSKLRLIFGIPISCSSSRRLISWKLSVTAGGGSSAGALKALLIMK
jgi:hypothetical protein